MTLYDQDTAEPPPYAPDPYSSPERMTPADVAVFLEAGVVASIRTLLACGVTRDVIRAGAEGYIATLRPGCIEVAE